MYVEVITSQMCDIFRLSDGDFYYYYYHHHHEMLYNGVEKRN